MANPSLRRTVVVISELLNFLRVPVLLAAYEAEAGGLLVPVSLRTA